MQFNRDISKWDAPNGQDMSDMFNSARQFNRDDLKCGVPNMQGMSGHVCDAADCTTPRQKEVWQVVMLSEEVEQVTKLSEDVEQAAEGHENE